VLTANSNNLRPESLTTVKWYVWQVKPLNEKKVYSRLQALNLEVFLPLHEVVRQWSDRKKKVSVPLIPSVVFVKCTEKELAISYSVLGVVGVLRYLGKPAIVRDYEIDNLRILLQEWDANVIEVSTESFAEGEVVRVAKGPFKGLTATAITFNGKHRVVVKIEALGSNFVVNVPRSFLKKINNEAA
jgi:transcription antitermination factor NusG